jgi:hypothetical protein
MMKLDIKELMTKPLTSIIWIYDIQLFSRELINKNHTTNNKSSLTNFIK